jgi:hypothetical protein
VRIMGSKGDLLRTLAASSGVKHGTPGVRSSVPNWRTGCPPTSIDFPINVWIKVENPLIHPLIRFWLGANECEQIGSVGGPIQSPACNGHAKLSACRLGETDGRRSARLSRVPAGRVKESSRSAGSRADGRWRALSLWARFALMPGVGAPSSEI